MIEYIFLAERDDISRIIGIEYLNATNSWISVIKAGPDGELTRCNLIAQTIGPAHEPLWSDPAKVIRGVSGENACNLFMYICAKLNREEKKERTIREEWRRPTTQGEIVFYLIYDKQTGQPLYQDKSSIQTGDITAVNTIAENAKK